MEKYREILQIICNKDQEYQKTAFYRLNNVAENPEIYKDVFFRSPDEDSDLAWLQVIDDLIENNCAFETDWKEDYAEVKAQMEELSRKKGILLSLENDNHLLDLEAEEYFPKINQLLFNTDFSIINLDIDSDSYVTALTNKSKIPQLLKLDERIKLY